MKQILILSLSFLLSSYLFAQDASITGKWILEKFENENGTDYPYEIIDFLENREVQANGINISKWKLNKQKNTIIFSNGIKDKLNGKAEIIELNNKNFVYKKKKDIYYFTKYNLKEIAEINKKSNLDGLWLMKNDDEKLYVRFEQPDKYKEYYTSYGQKSSVSGNWFYLPKENKVVIISYSDFFRRITDVKFSKEDKLTLSCKTTETTLEFNKIKTEKTIIDSLNFSADDMQNQNIDLIPDNWLNLELIAENLKTKDTLYYNKLEYLSDINSIDTVNFIVTPEINNFSEIEYKCRIVNGKDTINYARFELGNNEEFPFLPFDSEKINVTGKEKLNLEQETYNCTVVELYDEFNEQKAKLWLVDNQPGIFTKIILQKKEFDNETNYIFELKK